MTIYALNSLISEERLTSNNFWINSHDLVHILTEFTLLDISDAELLIVICVYDQLDKYELIVFVDIFWYFDGAFGLDLASKEVLYIFLY